MIKFSLTRNITKNTKWYIFPFLLLLLACPTEDDPPEPQPSPDPEEYIEEGWDDLSSGSYEDALENFDEALSVDPENIPASIGMAWTLLIIDSGESMEEMIILFENGVSDSTWSSDAYCGMSIVSFAQGNYTTAIAYADSLLSIDPNYVFENFSEIDYYDILLVKAQAQFLTLDYLGANMTMSQINPSLYLDPDQDSWEVNGTQYFSFESALSAVISSVTLQYDSEGFISNP
tara:strand:- start:55 stop:750 length:696 start_codon:yes stop_codon:yes gene_type:complete